MNKTYFLLICCFTLIMGCTSENPVKSANEKNLKTWISLPVAVSFKVENSLFTSARINGSQGGELILQGSYQTFTSNVIDINSRLVIPPDAYSGLKTLTQEMWTETYTDFGPPMVFSQPLLLNYSITGLDLSGIDHSLIDFYYMDPSGNCELTEYDSLIVDVVSGTLKVVNARIPHFSRYGWAK